MDLGIVRVKEVHDGLRCCKANKGIEHRSAILVQLHFPTGG